MLTAGKSPHGPRALALPVTSATALAIRFRVVTDGRLEDAWVGATVVVAVAVAVAVAVEMVVAVAVAAVVAG